MTLSASEGATRTLAGMVRACGSAPYTLYYEVLALPLAEFERKLCLKEVSAFDPAAMEVLPLPPVLLDSEATVADLVAAARAACPRLPPAPAPLRAVVVLRGEIYTTLDPAAPAAPHVYRQLRVEPVPEDQLAATAALAAAAAAATANENEAMAVEAGADAAADPAEQLGRVFHMARFATHTHGIPFYFAFRAGETVAGVRARLQKYLHIGDKEWSKWKLCLVSPGQVVTPLDPPADAEEAGASDAAAAAALFPLAALATHRVALDHPNRDARKAFAGERAIKIHN